MTDTDTDTEVDTDDSDLGYIKRMALAAPDTTLGKLQRGRGAGWLECLELPREEANDLLWRCIVLDPRLDQQVERRAEYYASLAVQLEFDVARLLPSELPPEESWRDRRLVPDVLVELDRGGVDGAGSVLLAQIVPQDEMYEDVLGLMPLASQRTNAALPATLLERRDDENLVGTVNRFYENFPWEDWAVEHPRIESALREVRRRYAERAPAPRRVEPNLSAPIAQLLEHRWNWRRPPPRLVQRLTEDLRPGEREELLAALTERADPSLAFMILGLQGDPIGLPAATAIFDEPQLRHPPDTRTYYARRAAAGRYFRMLGAEHTLPLAREWLSGHSDGRFRHACGILEDHAEARDVPSVRAALALAFAQRQIYPLGDLVEVLGRHPQLGPYPELSEIFESIEYSHARWRVARVMADSDRSSFEATYARECIWDSDDGVREVARMFVDPDDESAAERLRAIDAERASTAERWSRHRKFEEERRARRAKWQPVDA